MTGVSHTPGPVFEPRRKHVALFMCIASFWVHPLLPPDCAPGCLSPAPREDLLGGLLCRAFVNDLVPCSLTARVSVLLPCFHLAGDWSFSRREVLSLSLSLSLSLFLSPTHTYTHAHTGGCSHATLCLLLGQRYLAGVQALVDFCAVLLVLDKIRTERTSSRGSYGIPCLPRMGVAPLDVFVNVRSALAFQLIRQSCRKRDTQCFLDVEDRFWAAWHMLTFTYRPARVNLRAAAGLLLF